VWYAVSTLYLFLSYYKLSLDPNTLSHTHTQISARRDMCASSGGFLEYRLSRELILSFLVWRAARYVCVCVFVCEWVIEFDCTPLFHSHRGDLECISDCHSWVSHSHGVGAKDSLAFPACCFAQVRMCLCVCV
jgi:hypothetical protein